MAIFIINKKKKLKGLHFQFIFKFCYQKTLTKKETFFFGAGGDFFEESYITNEESLNFVNS